MHRTLNQILIVAIAGAAAAAGAGALKAEEQPAVAAGLPLARPVQASVAPAESETLPPALAACVVMSVCTLGAYLLGRSTRWKLNEQSRQVHAELLEQSHRAGMSEVASGVIHNIGNVLNNVTVAATLIREKLHKSEITDLNRVLDLLENQQHRLPEFLNEDPRGKQLPRYLLEAGRVLQTERFELLSRVETLCKSVDHIAGILRIQKQHVKAEGVRQRVLIREVVSDALDISRVLLERHSVAIETYGPGAEIYASLDRHRLLQILVNLISNAVQAITRAGVADGKIVINVATVDDQLHLELSDNGDGISADVLPRIFHHAFTTRDEGQGLGLHDSALAAAGMGGELSAQSDGPGCGAKFLLKAPLNF